MNATTYTLTVKNTQEGKRLVSILKRSEAVSNLERETLKKVLKKKSIQVVENQADVALGVLMSKVKTGKTVSRKKVMEYLSA